MNGSPLKILVIEDNEGDYYLIKALLSEVSAQQYEFDWVWTFEDGRDRLCNQELGFDACLLDYQLDPHDGLELLDFARECKTAFPIIVLTGYQQYETDLAAMQAGAADYLSKNELTSSVLERAIRYAIQQRRAEEQRLSLMAEREAREHAEQASKYFRQLAESLPQLIWATDPAGEVNYMSRQWCEFVGKSEAEQLGHGWQEAIHPEDRPRTIELWKATLAGHAEYDIEYRIRRHDGQYRWFKTRAVPLRDAQDRIERWLGSCTDIHAAKVAEAELKRLNETLEERVAARTAEAEQRATQLRALAGELTQAEQRERRRLAQTLHDHLQQFLVAVRLRLDRIKSKGALPITEVDSLLDLIDQAINASRSLTVELSPPALYSSGLIPALQWLAKWMKEKHGLDVTVQANSEPLPEGEDLRVCLFNSVRELLFNVVKHAGTDAAKVEVDQLNGTLRVIVQDHGHGFEANGNLHRSGFGLFSIRERMELMNGEFHLESARGEGTRAILLAPVAQKPEEPGRS